MTEMRELVGRRDGRYERLPESGGLRFNIKTLDNERSFAHNFLSRSPHATKWCFVIIRSAPQHMLHGSKHHTLKEPYSWLCHDSGFRNQFQRH